MKVKWRWFASKNRFHCESNVKMCWVKCTLFTINWQINSFALFVLSTWFSFQTNSKIHALFHFAYAISCAKCARYLIHPLAGCASELMLLLRTWGYQSNRKNHMLSVWMWLHLESMMRLCLNQFGVAIKSLPYEHSHRSWCSFYDGDILMR